MPTYSEFLAQNPGVTPRQAEILVEAGEVQADPAPAEVEATPPQPSEEPAGEPAPEASPEPSTDSEPSEPAVSDPAEPAQPTLNHLGNDPTAPGDADIPPEPTD